MGLSFHYSGRFSRNASLPDMIEEVKDIVETRKWPYQIFETDFPEAGIVPGRKHDGNIYGISFTPPECETVSLCFLSNGRMSCPVNLHFYGNSNDRQEQKYLYMLAVKTQFAGEETHKFIIELFRYLKKKKYFEKLDIRDEGMYWETADEQQLHEVFVKYTTLFDSLKFAVDHVPKNEAESWEDYFGRLMDMIKNKDKNSE